MTLSKRFYNMSFMDKYLTVVTAVVLLIFGTCLYQDHQCSQKVCPAKERATPLAGSIFENRCGCVDVTNTPKTAPVRRAI